MEIPTNLFRSYDGCTFEFHLEAHEQSVEYAACELKRLLDREDKFTADGSEILEQSAEVKKAVNTLIKALDGKLVTSYKLSK